MLDRLSQMLPALTEQPRPEMEQKSQRNLALVWRA